MKTKRIFLMLVLNILSIATYKVFCQQLSELKIDSIETITKEELMLQKEANKEKIAEEKESKNETKTSVNNVNKDSKAAKLKINRNQTSNQKVTQKKP